MKFKKLLCTAFLALSWCATSAAAFDAEDIEFAKRQALSWAPVRGVPNGTLAARIQYYTQTRDHLRAILNMGFEAYTRSLDFPYDSREIAFLNRQCASGNFNADNFVSVIKKAIILHEDLRAELKD